MFTPYFAEFNDVDWVMLCYVVCGYRKASSCYIASLSERSVVARSDVWYLHSPSTMVPSVTDGNEGATYGLVRCGGRRAHMVLLARGNREVTTTRSYWPSPCTTVFVHVNTAINMSWIELLYAHAGISYSYWDKWGRRPNKVQLA